MTEENEQKKPGGVFTLPHTHKLKYPIQIGDETTTEIVFKRRLIAKDLKGIPADGMTLDCTTLMLSRVVGKPVAVMEQLDAEDLTDLAEVIGSFLSRGRTTGGN